MKSIMQTRKDQCYICDKLFDDPFQKITEEHHIMMGTANRRLSTKYGLTVRLCAMHHRTGKNAVHNDAEMRRWLEKEGQKRFMEVFPDKDFREIFGKNFL